ncbi:D-hexose-6-phosphate mutarotase [Leucothrix sargassi]|nr:D-hexose-6-phosphate mutarotase [Leucothrix sargassi]
MLTLPSSVAYQQRPDTVKTLLVDNDFATAEVALFGAHFLSFKPKHDNRERLYVSEAAIMDGSKAIRGGVPICWPWFGGLNEGFQMHGYARDRVWDLQSASELEQGTELVFTLEDTKGDGFSGEATLALTVTIGKTLTMSLSTTNIGNDAFELSTALHTYFAVENILDVELKGMSGDYSDKVNDWSIGTTPDVYTFPDRTDRIHFNPVEKLTIVEGETTTDIHLSGHDSVVVWNPGQALSVSMSDMADDSYVRMLCVETAVTQGMQLAAGQTHELKLVVD